LYLHISRFCQRAGNHQDPPPFPTRRSSDLSSIASIAGMLGAILVGAVTGNADAVPGIIAMGQGVAMQQQINFTRMEEHEADRVRSEEHTSELQSRENLVCRLLLEKKNKDKQ